MSSVLEVPESQETYEWLEQFCKKHSYGIPLGQKTFAKTNVPAPKPVSQQSELLMSELKSVLSGTEKSKCCLYALGEVGKKVKVKSFKGLQRTKAEASRRYILQV